PPPPPPPPEGTSAPEATDPGVLESLAAMVAEEDIGGGEEETPTTSSRPGGASRTPKFNEKDGLPDPDERGSVRAVMTEPPFSLKDEERVIRAINAMEKEGYRYIGVERNGKLLRMVTQSDLRQIMGPFYGTKAMSARDKAICTIPLGKINESQRLVQISVAGTINQAADLIGEYGLRALPVISSKGVLRGFVTVHGILAYFRQKRAGGPKAADT
ncbi:MAG: CBS domain-containing protein, partial [Magnetococcales bacterium]|nr:CBS domain-containing protein [Magnetococcales bacterium]